MSRYHKRQSNISDTLKDYLVPIIGGVLLLLLFWSFLGGSDDSVNENTDLENRVPAEIEFIGSDTEAFIVYPGDSKEEITSNSSLYKGESIIVKEGSLQVVPTAGTTIKLNKIAELKYDDAAEYSLYSSDAWIETEDKISLAMRYASIDTGNNTTISLTQNEAVSTVYVLAGTAKVTNLGGSSTNLVKGQKVSVSRQDAAKGDIDLSSEKTDIDSYFKSSDWFIENEGYIVLQKEDITDITTGSGETDEQNIGDTSGIYLAFENLRDEMTVSTSSIEIKGTTVSESVSALSISGKQVELGEGGTFSSTINLTNSVNDLVIKIYDENKNILEKKVYTVYTSNVSGLSSSSINTPTSSSSGAGENSVSQTTNFEVDGTDFGFTAPSVTGKFSTSGSEITIRGITTAEGITGVQVNGFDLSSFNGSTWRYHAFTRFDTLQDGTNQYKIDYLKDGNIVYSDYYTIVKKDSETTTTTTSNSTVDEESNSESETNEEPETAL